MVLIAKKPAIFPPHVHTLLSDVPKSQWPVQEQEGGTCGIVAAANALNILRYGRTRYDRDHLIATAHGWLHRKYGSASFTTEMILRRHAAGTHFGNLRRTDPEKVLRSLIDYGIPVCVEIDQYSIGPIKIYGQHSIVLVGYSQPYEDTTGKIREEYYFVDSSYRFGGPWSINSNNADRDGDGIEEAFPGNRTMQREEFLSRFQTGIYFPVFKSQDDHDAWYSQNMICYSAFSIFRWLRDQFVTGVFDQLK